ncbi:PREDICTED: fatty acid synthase-like [Vollenhovia emeryi]|uniref:fatty acid synthase-like n=1 Tax=Vollenhovia emeryi TaxID=411798 RepID=UPI0005F3C882|nr:PREDICTED: fatty acid synthase-like [Vollenhovia emeryi]
MNRSNLHVSIDAEEEIVISGIAGRFPNTNNLKELQDNLFNKMDLGTKEHGRWNNYFDMPSRIGKIDNIEKFDSQFFNISTIEADMLDPMARMVLEHTYEALVDAGVNPKQLRGTKTGIFTAICADAYSGSIYSNPNLGGVPPYWCNRAFVANRISYWLGVNGPSYNMDAACSSSLFAITEAYRYIQAGQCDAAIVATSNLCVHPFINFGFYKLGMHL